MRGESIMVSPWPVFDPASRFETEEKKDFTKIMEMIRAIRNCRAQMNVPPKKKARVFIETKFVDVFTQCKVFIERLGFRL